MRAIVIIVTGILVAAIPLACGKQSSTTRNAPSSAASPSADSPVDFLTLIGHEVPTQTDIDAFLAIAESGNASTTMRVFTTPESDFAAERLKDPDAKVEDYIAVSAHIRRFARAVIARGNTLRDQGDIAAARRHYQAVLVAADANSWEGVAQIGLMTADALRRAAEAELTTLPAE